MNPSYLQIPCLELVQPIGKFYIGVMDAADVVRISFADIRTLDRDLDDYMGIQRKLSQKRVEELQQYVRTIDATFPTSVILAVSSDDVTFDSAGKVMSIREGEEVAKIIDGQHRIKGMDEYSNGQFQLNVTIFVDMDIEDQAMVFATINLAQTKVNKSLVYDLYEYTKSRSPQKTAHNIARLLNTKEGSPFKGRIKVLGEANAASGPRRLQTITQATFVEALLKMISGSNHRALEDRDLLKRNKRPARATVEESRELIFRNLFLANRDAAVANTIWNYFGAVRERWPQAWGDLDRPGNILPRTNGFRAFMRLLPNVCQSLGGAEQNLSQDRFVTLFHKLQLRDDDFNIENFKPGTSGERSLLDDLLIGLGLTL